MSELFQKTLDVSPEILHSRLEKHVVEDTKENVHQRTKTGVFMGKIGAKKFYVLYKPPYFRQITYMTMMKGDIGPSEEDENKTRLRYRFCKFRIPLAVASVLLIAVTLLAVYAFCSNSINLAGDFCILGFWGACVGLYFFAVLSSRAARDRLLEFVETLSRE